MEARRFTILSSNLCPSRSGPVLASSSTASASSRLFERQSVLDSNEETFRSDCVFCQIIRGESPAFKDAYDMGRRLRPRENQTQQFRHTLVIPKSHFSSLDTTPPSTHIHIIPPKMRDCLWTSESLHRCPLNLDQETSGLAIRVRELLLNISKESKDQALSLP